MIRGPNSYIPSKAASTLFFSCVTREEAPEAGLLDMFNKAFESGNWAKVSSKRGV
jgi:hypothetical protein